MTYYMSPSMFTTACEQTLKLLNRGVIDETLYYLTIEMAYARLVATRQATKTIEANLSGQMTLW